MSATGRGTVRDEKDFYATPWPAFAPLLDFLPRDVAFWEPCAGDGRLIRWLRESGRAAYGADLFPQECEIYPRFGVDFLQDQNHREFVITNPPFSVAFEMCQHARNSSREFMFLLRLSFLESDERSDWLSANEPAALFVLKKRPSFVMACRCKGPIYSPDDGAVVGHGCDHSWILPIDSARLKVCPKCGKAGAVKISTSDNSGYAWYYWGHRFQGIRHV